MYLSVEETLFWCNTGSDEKSQVLEVLRLQVLSPFLFSQQLLCDQVCCLFVSLFDQLIYVVCVCVCV